jgi:hypothetical protein
MFRQKQEGFTGIKKIIGVVLTKTIITIINSDKGLSVQQKLIKPPFNNTPSMSKNIIFFVISRPKIIVLFLITIHLG